MSDPAALRKAMIEQQIRSRGIDNPAVLKAMEEVPREEFVPPDVAEFAYEDAPLPIEEGQTISQPYIVALMTELLELSENDRVLEIGTGSGYAAAVLSRIAAEVYSVERHERLAGIARLRLQRLGYGNVQVLCGDGTLGWADHAPYTAIVVTAGGPEIPQPLIDQLAPGGRLVMPVGEHPRVQQLIRLRRKDGTFERQDLGGVRFVPLIGAAAWPAPPAEERKGKGKETVPELIRRGALPTGMSRWKS